MLRFESESRVQLQGEREATDKEVCLTVQLLPAPPSDAAAPIRDGAAAATCTRHLRVAPSSHTAAVNEAFLLEVPSATAAALAADVSAEVTARRLHVINRAAPRLTRGVYVSVLLHDQAATTAADGVIAHGGWQVPPEWLCAAAMTALKGGPAPAAASPASPVAAAGAPAAVALAAAAGAAGAAVGFDAQLQRVAPWINETPSASELRSSRSQRGFRSLRLAAPGAAWLPVVRDGAQQPATGAGGLSGSVLGLDLASGLALEESFVDGVRRETIRSTVQVVNSLDFPVEVRSPAPLVFLLLRF